MTTSNETSHEYCTVVFRLKNGRVDAGKFVYALACRVEQWTHIEVVKLEIGDLCYECAQSGKQAEKGAEHDQPQN
jgi:hypothetical protein